MPLLMCRFAACSFNLYDHTVCFIRLSSNNSQYSIIWLVFLLLHFLNAQRFCFLLLVFSFFICAVIHIVLYVCFSVIFFRSVCVQCALRSMPNNIRRFYYFDRSHPHWHRDVYCICLGILSCAWLTCSLKH